jgi:hypothetical protein
MCDEESITVAKGIQVRVLRSVKLRDVPKIRRQAVR